jgi:catechol 2,3-dioxygenase-like lactoylglutathione lyase family enzyme
MAQSPAYRPSHLGLCVSDLDRSIRFYCDGLGFERAESYELDSSAAEGLDRALEVPGRAVLRSQYIAYGDLRIELLYFSSPQPIGEPSAHRNQRGLTHLAFYVDDVDAAAAHLSAHGGTIIDSTRTKPGIDIVFLADPDGTRVELMGLPM